MKVHGHVHEKYRLGPRLGAGGMADVFRAELTGAEGFSRPVAIKRLHAGVSSDPAFSAMFVREARVLSALHHPGIVSVLDFDRDADGRLFLVMELVDGVTLSRLVQRGQLPPAVAGHVLAEVLRGLGHAHARGILHRDVTPHNVLLGWTGEIKLGDFGLAQASASSRVSDGGLIRGKVPYLSPEQLQGLTIDARSDLFSVGVMSYQLLTGRYPFLGRTDQTTIAESIARMLTATIVPPRDLRPEIPAALSDVVMRLLERERERRFTSADMVLAALPAPERGRELLIELLAERFPGRVSGGASDGLPGRASQGAPEALPEAVIDLASADTWPAAGTHAGRAAGQASDPWFHRQTVSLPGVRAQAGQPGVEERSQARSRRWWAGLPLVLVVLPLAWLAGTQWSRSTGGSAGPAAAAGRLDQASRATGRAGHADRARSAQRDRLPTAGMPPATATTPVATHAATEATMEAAMEEAAGPAVDAHEPVHTGHRAGHGAGHGRSRASRAQPRRTQRRAHAAAAIVGTDTGAQPAGPPPAPAAAPDQAPAEQRYEDGWTELTPQRTLTGEIPIRREAP